MLQGDHVVSNQNLDHILVRFRNLNLFGCKGKLRQLYVSPKIDYQRMLGDWDIEGLDYEV
jgi:hypothetical protein